MGSTRTRAAVVACVLLAAIAPIGGTSAGAAGGDPAQVGQFTAPFEEAGGQCHTDADGRQLCKPAGTQVSDLATGRVLYWDALEGTENINVTALLELGTQARNDRTRILDLSTGTPRFRAPTPEDSGANPTGNPSPEYLPGVPHDDPIVNDGDLFCSDQVQLPDGRILAVGGTDYYSEPYVGTLNGNSYGLAELEGLKAGRIFDPYTETWTQTGSMNYARWYPSLVTLPDGKIFVASGVSKLVKPVFPDRPLDSGTNVRQTETYDPTTGQWSLNSSEADRSLPLYPRLHLLPDGHVYYDAAGQVFNPLGQSYDEAFWNIASSYDPTTQRWTDLGVPGLGLGALPGLPDLPGQNGDLSGLPLMANVPLDGLPNVGGQATGVPGFRGSAFSMMLPLQPDAQGRYSTAQFLSAGGVIGTTPGTVLATTSSQINTVSIDGGGHESLSSRPTGPLTTPRWYGSGVLLPSGEVMALSGADKDEVVAPGLGKPVTTPELFDPRTETWHQMAPQGRARTYHNTAMLLPDGRVLVGGHAPIPTLYGFDVTVPGFSPEDGRDPSFEIYSPPYLFRGDRPTITSNPGRIDTGTSFSITMGSDAEAAAVQNGGSVVLMRNTSITHLIDGDQRSVVLPIARRDGATLVLTAPPDRAVAPAGPYLLFANRGTNDGPVPSVGRQVFVDAPVPAALTTTLPAAQPGKVSAPYVPRAPQDVITQNLGRALGVPGVSVPTRLASSSRGLAQLPSWLVVVALGLPLCVLAGGPIARRRRRPRSRPG